MLNGQRDSQVMEENKRPYGEKYLEVFDVGDLVSWTDLGKPKEYGFIQRIYVQDCGPSAVGREFMFARIKKTNGSTENYMLSALTLESGNNNKVVP